MLKLVLTELADGAETSKGSADGETGKALLSDGRLVVSPC